MANALEMFRKADSLRFSNDFDNAIVMFDAAVDAGLLFDGISDEARRGFELFRTECVRGAERAEALRLMDEEE